MSGEAERFIEAMTPAAGSPLAAAAVLEVLAADDRDAKAVEVTERLHEQMKPAIAAFQRIADALTASFGADWHERVGEITQSARVEADDEDDQEPFDEAPDDCWRCDAVEATTDVGLCDPCWDDLVRR